MPIPPQPAIEVSNLVKSYAGVTAVNGISFTVPKGEIIGFLGPNGAGKSTTMRILTGYLPATSGSVSICGYSVVTDPDAVKKRVGYMPENNPLPDEMRVSEYLYFRGRLKEIPRGKLGSRIDEVLELCDLKRVRHKIIGKLSKGFRQRVGIAESVLAEPPVIIMDEPTIGLDPHQILIVRDLIASLRGRMTVLISSHILPEIEMTCDRVLIINQGRIVAQGTPADLRREVLGQSAYEIEGPWVPALPPRRDRPGPVGGLRGHAGPVRFPDHQAQDPERRGLGGGDSAGVHVGGPARAGAQPRAPDP